MQGERPLTKQEHVDAGDGVERTVTQARGGVRRGMTKRVLALSTLLAVIGIGAIWLLYAGFAPNSQPSLPTQTAAAAAPQPNLVRSQAWDQAHLGADGLEKCSAFRKVFDRTTALQGRDQGQMSASERTALVAELNTAKAMPPVSLTPFQCGIPLG
jgi:hypothetical protein